MAPARFAVVPPVDIKRESPRTARDNINSRLICLPLSVLSFASKRRIGPEESCTANIANG